MSTRTKVTCTGPLSVKRMETIDEEVTKLPLDHLEKARAANRPFFLWWNSTRMHIDTHLKPESVGKTGLGVYPPSQKVGSFSLDQVLEKLQQSGSSGR